MRQSLGQGMSPIRYPCQSFFVHRCLIIQYGFSLLDQFEKLILNEKYVIQGNKIFYLYDIIGDVFPEGVFEAEDLIAEDKSKSRYDFSKGGYILKGSQRFFNVYQ